MRHMIILALLASVPALASETQVWSLIGLYSPKGPDWANMGRGLIRGARRRLAPRR